MGVLFGLQDGAQGENDQTTKDHAPGRSTLSLSYLQCNNQLISQLGFTFCTLCMCPFRFYKRSSPSQYGSVDSKTCLKPFSTLCQTSIRKSSSVSPSSDNRLFHLVCKLLRIPLKPDNQLYPSFVLPSKIDLPSLSPCFPLNLSCSPTYLGQSI